MAVIPTVTLILVVPPYVTSGGCRQASPASPEGCACPPGSVLSVVPAPPQAGLRPRTRLVVAVFAPPRLCVFDGVWASHHLFRTGIAPSPGPGSTSGGPRKDELTSWS